MKRALGFSVFALVLAWFGRDGVRVHAQTLISPSQLKAPRLAALQCSGSLGSSSDCTGFYYLDVITPAGTELKLIAYPAAPTIDPTHWSVVP